MAARGGARSGDAEPLARPRGRPPPGGRGGSPRWRTTRRSTASRSRPSTTTSPAGLRVDALARSRRGLRAARRPRRSTTPSSTRGDLAFGPPILRPPSLRDFYAFEGHVRTMWERRGGEIPEAWYRLPIFYFSNISEIRGPDDPVWAPRGSHGARLRARGRRAHRHAGARPGGGAGRGGDRRLHRSSTTGRRATSSATRPRSGSGRPRARTSRRSIGPWLVTPDELADARQPGTGYDLAMTATVNGAETSRGRWSDAQFSFGQMIERASADVHAAPGRPARQRDGRRRLPPRDPRRDPRPLPRAGRRGDPAIERLGRPP